jgi:dihydropteroate synthase
MIFRGRQFEFRFPRPALVMGIVNVTPDSFSDGGKFFDADSAVDHAIRLVKEGAEIIDVGGESTRPKAEPVSEEEEIRRVLPVIEKLAGKVRVPISIDTMKPKVARRALEAGACIVNDVAASRENDEMRLVVAEFGAGYVAMHMQGTPQTMQNSPSYNDVVDEVLNFFSDQLTQLKRGGIAAEQVVFDPGIGFGKTIEHNLQLLAGLRRFTNLERPLLLGVSRKSFLGKISGTNERLPAALACTTLAVESGVNIFRAHDVAETLQAIRMAEAVLAQKQRRDSVGE